MHSLLLRYLLQPAQALDDISCLNDISVNLQSLKNSSESDHTRTVVASLKIDALGAQFIEGSNH
jgi:hypothetical protein